MPKLKRKQTKQAELPLEKYFPTSAQASPLKTNEEQFGEKIYEVVYTVKYHCRMQGKNKIHAEDRVFRMARWMTSGWADGIRKFFLPKVMALGLIDHWIEFEELD